MESPTEVEVAWAAGLFEGEGTVYLTKSSQVTAHLTSTDKDVVERFARIVGHKTVYGHNRPTVSGKAVWRWHRVGKGAEKVVWLLLPHLGKRRREKALEVLSQRQEYVVQMTLPKTCVECGDLYRPRTPNSAHKRRYCGKTCRDAVKVRLERERRKAVKTAWEALQ